MTDRLTDEDQSPCFLVDKTAGRLARWLRILGLDTEYAATCDASSIVRLARQSGRTVITRNRSLLDRLGESCILLESEHLGGQIKQILRVVGARSLSPFSRCNICNAKLVEVSRELVRGRVPAYVFKNHERFSVCPVCGRYYWQGTHWCVMHREIERILGDASYEDKQNRNGTGYSRP